MDYGLKSRMSDEATAGGDIDLFRIFPFPGETPVREQVRTPWKHRILLWHVDVLVVLISSIMIYDGNTYNDIDN